MKNSYDLEKHLDAKYHKMLNYDKIEIDNPDRYHPISLLYFDRLRMIISIIKRAFPIPDQIRIGDFACAQGNMSLLLAEMGYKVFAVDINPTFIEYSKMKYERGEIEWIVGNIDELNFSANMLDVAIMGELIEHCAYPEKIIEKVVRCVRLGGLLILTTPNGARIKTRLPTFRQVFSQEQRKMFEERQFGPGGENHLFLFKLEEIKYIIPENANIIEKGYLGSTILVNKYSHQFLKLFPLRLVEHIIRIFSRIPIINKKTFNNLYVVLKKEYIKGV